MNDELDFSAFLQRDAAQADVGDMADGVSELVEVGGIHFGDSAGVAGVDSFFRSECDGDGQAAGFQGVVERAATGAAVFHGEREEVHGGGFVGGDENAAAGVDDFPAAAVAGTADEEGHGAVMDPFLKKSVPGEGVMPGNVGPGGRFTPVGSEAAKRDAAVFV